MRTEMITTNPVPAGQCRKCQLPQMIQVSDIPARWFQGCKAVEDIEPEDTLASDLACKLEQAYIRLASHNDCPLFQQK